MARKSQFDHYPKTYPGVKLDYEMLTNSSGRTFELMMQIGPIIDLPFSLVFDTLVYPYDYSVSTDKKSIENEK